VDRLHYYLPRKGPADRAVESYARPETRSARIYSRLPRSGRVRGEQEKVRRDSQLIGVERLLGNNGDN